MKFLIPDKSLPSGKGVGIITSQAKCRQVCSLRTCPKSPRLAVQTPETGDQRYRIRGPVNRLPQPEKLLSRLRGRFQVYFQIKFTKLKFRSNIFYLLHGTITSKVEVNSQFLFFLTYTSTFRQDRYVGVPKFK